MTKPTKNGENGRDNGGRFTKGNPGGPGNPHIKRVARLRSTLLKAVKPKDLAEVIAAMLTAAKNGDVAAAKEVMDRVLGKASATEILERIEKLEAQLAAQTANESEVQP